MIIVFFSRDALNNEKRKREREREVKKSCIFFFLWAVAFTPPN